MKIVFWGNGDRGVSCLEAVHNGGHDVRMVVSHPVDGDQWCGSVADLASRLGIEVMHPDNPDAAEVADTLRSVDADLFVLAGYGKILRSNTIEIPDVMCINLHAGKLPQYRGSSPMNWALINGDPSFTLSIIRVDAGIDTGDILVERTFDISPEATIRDLHCIANQKFPVMLLEVLSQIEDRTHVLTPQCGSEASYYPLRFPDDGLVLWDMYTAEQIHNRIRALTEPYPCAFSYFRGVRVNLLASGFNEHDYFGEPGRVYRKSKRGLLVCALDKCLWIKEAALADSGNRLFDQINPYDTLATLRGSVMAQYS